MADFQRFQVSTGDPIGPPLPLPADLVGLAVSSLLNLEEAVGVPACTELGYLDTGFMPVIPTPGVNVTAVQLRIALSDMGLLDDLNAGIASLGDPDATIRWNYGNLFYADQGFIVAGCNAVGINATTRATIFANASNVPP